MSDTKVVRREDIDEKLAIEISCEVGVSASALQIMEVLAYLANHPVEPTEELQKQIVLHWNKADCPQGWSKFAYEEFQRIAYLKKEPPIPEELKELMTQHFDKASFTECFNERLIKAYRLGQKSK